MGAPRVGTDDRPDDRADARIHDFNFRSDANCVARARCVNCGEESKRQHDSSAPKGALLRASSVTPTLIDLESGQRVETKPVLSESRCRDNDGVRRSIDDSSFDAAGYQAWGGHANSGAGLNVQHLRLDGKWQRE